MTDDGRTERAMTDRAATEQEAIRATLSAYCQTLDDGRFDEWVDLLAEDVAFAVMGRVDRGRAAVRAFVEPVQQADSRGRHVLSEPLIALEGDTATATTDFCFLARDLTVTAAGRYHDVLVRDADRWRIAAREIVFVGDEPRGIPDPEPGPQSDPGPVSGPASHSHSDSDPGPDGTPVR